MGLMTRPPVVRKSVLICNRDPISPPEVPVSLLMRYFCEGAGSSQGLEDRTKGETNTTDFIKEGGDHLIGGGASQK